MTTTTGSILIVEDEKHIAEGLRFNLEAEGYEARVITDGGEALEVLANRGENFDAVILDVMLPETDGFTIAQRMRETKNFSPILMVTARSHPEDVLRGFESGADDYIAKPFELKIFLARLRGLLRRREWLLDNENADSRSAVAVADLVKVNGKTIDFPNLQIKDGDKILQLTLMEAKLLHYLIDNAEKPVSRKMILEEVWDLNEDTDTRAIDNFIVRLRKYLEDTPTDPKILQTVRGVGYRFSRNLGA